MVANTKLAEFDQKLAEIHEKQVAIVEAGKASEGGNMSKEQLAEFDKLDAEFKQLSADRDVIKGQQERIAAIESRRLTSHDPVRIGNQKEAFEDDPKKGFKTPREFLGEVVKSFKLGRFTDNRMKYLAAGADEQSTFADPYGGFLIPEGFSPNVMSLMAESDPIGSRVTRIPMGSPTVKIPARVDKNHTSSVSGGLTVSRREQSGAITSSRMEFEQIKLEATGLFGLSHATNELLQDSPQSFVAILEAGFRDQFAYHLIDERINGTGVGEFEGIMNSPALVTVAKESGQAADTIVIANINKMRSRCWNYGNAVWLYNHDCLPQLLTLNDGTNYVWTSSAREAEPDRLYGRPAFATEYTKTVGDLGDIILCVWSEFLEGTLEPLQSAESMHVRFENHESTFKFWTRNAGAGWWRSALTPKNSSNTLSPFVALAARA